MSHKILKTIDMSLDKASINRAIREIKMFRKQLQDSMNELIQQLMEEGVGIAKMQVASLEAFDTGNLEGSIHKGEFIPAWGVGWIVTDCPYAVFVEYGTGIVGAGSPHPGISDGDWTNPVVSRNGKTYNNYDSQDHGAEGWVYKSDKDGKYHWTAGYISRPFMYNTLRWLEEIAPDKASELFSQM